MHEVRIGISGWTYAPWRGTFYPKGTTQKRELEFASRKLRSIEINGTFYSLQTPKSFMAWREATPDDFVFSLKGGRYLTHMLRLKNVRVALANFLASGVLALEEKLGPILWQLPPNFLFDAATLEAFFDLLPRDTTTAARLAREHEPRLKKRAYLKPKSRRKLRYAIEVRHESFKSDAFIDLARRQDIAIVTADTAGKWPEIEEATSDFAYARLHGAEELYVSGYDDKTLDAWAKKIRRWRRRGDVFVYFDNDVKVRSPFDAMRLAAKLGIGEPVETPAHVGKIDEEARSEWPGISGRRRARSRERRA